jgi:hypothetical protein
MDPPSPVSELDRRNVTLFCDVEDGNPRYLDSVKWYFGGDLLKQLPLCTEAGVANGLCDIEPSRLMLEHVSQQFHGNFSCQGSNGAGWSKVSRQEELEIYCEFKLLGRSCSATQVELVRFPDRPTISVENGFFCDPASGGTF